MASAAVWSCLEYVAQSEANWVESAPNQLWPRVFTAASVRAIRSVTVCWSASSWPAVVRTASRCIPWLTVITIPFRKNELRLGEHFFARWRAPLVGEHLSVR